MGYKSKNMNESEKILYALDILQLTAKDEKNKNEIIELMNEFKLKIGKSISDEESEEQQDNEEKKEDE